MVPFGPGPIADDHSIVSCSWNRRLAHRMTNHSDRIKSLGTHIEMRAAARDDNDGSIDRRWIIKRNTRSSDIDTCEREVTDRVVRCVSHNSEVLTRHSERRHSLRPDTHASLMNKMWKNIRLREQETINMIKNINFIFIYELNSMWKELNIAQANNIKHMLQMLQCYNALIHTRTHFQYVLCYVYILVFDVWIKRDVKTNIVKVQKCLRPIRLHCSAVSGRQRPTAAAERSTDNGETQRHDDNINRLPHRCLSFHLISFIRSIDESFILSIIII